MKNVCMYMFENLSDRIEGKNQITHPYRKWLKMLLFLTFADKLEY